MQRCPECGNQTLASRVVGGRLRQECGLCGAHFGDREHGRAEVEEDEAQSHGFDPGVWPLVRVLRGLAGLAVLRADAGSPSGALPHVELFASGPDALLQLENLTKSLRLLTTDLLCSWRIELRFEHTLSFVLLPGSGSHAEASRDLDVLARQLERHTRLSFWRHASDGRTR